MPGIDTAAPDRTGDQQRILAVAELLAGFFLEHPNVLLDAIHQRGGQLLTQLVVLVANRRGDREAGRDRQADAGHLSQVRALAPQQCFLRTVPVGAGLPKVIDHL